ncbi:MAG: response regulator [Thermodesulfobacteriota bacterium]
MDRPQILIVDDSKEVLTALARELGDEPYTIFYAGSGEEALRIVKEDEIQVIVSDVKMPGMDGFELLDRIKELYPDMVRVVLSGHPDVKLILKMVNERGVDRYLTKPWHGENVKATILQCLELFGLRAEVKELRDKSKSD